MHFTATISVGDNIKYQALGGPTEGIVKDTIDGVLLVFVAPESWLLMRASQVKPVVSKTSINGLIQILTDAGLD